MTSWNPDLYEARHSFVWERARDLLGLLAPQDGERILDAGCGTGQLTAELAQAGSRVLGIDSSPAMIEQARKNFPQLEFAVADIRSFAAAGEFDAVFSNAVLHWVREADAAAEQVQRALAPGGRFVAEFGGRRNTERIMEAIFAALDALGAGRIEPWYFPGLAEYATLLERHGFEVRYAALIDRPTPLAGGETGLANWLEMFGRPFLDLVGPARRDDFIRHVTERARPHLFRDGNWTVDYRRLRVAAVKI